MELPVGDTMETEVRSPSLVEVSRPNSEDTIAFLEPPGVDGDRPANEVLKQVKDWLKRSACLLPVYIVPENQEAIAKAMSTSVDF